MRIASSGRIGRGLRAGAGAAAAVAVCFTLAGTARADTGDAGLLMLASVRGFAGAEPVDGRELSRQRAATYTAPNMAPSGADEPAVILWDDFPPPKPGSSGGSGNPGSSISINSPR